jgi:hypothetical protein
MISYANAYQPVLSNFNLDRPVPNARSCRILLIVNLTHAMLLDVYPQDQVNKSTHSQSDVDSSTFRNANLG